jgi:hypothetical protein
VDDTREIRMTTSRPSPRSPRTKNKRQKRKAKPGLRTDAARSFTTAKDPKKQGQQANTRQNTTHQGYKQAR